MKTNKIVYKKDDFIDSTRLNTFKETYINNNTVQHYNIEVILTFSSTLQDTPNTTTDIKRLIIKHGIVTTINELNLCHTEENECIDKDDLNLTFLNEGEISILIPIRVLSQTALDGTEEINTALSEFIGKRWGRRQYTFNTKSITVNHLFSEISQQDTINVTTELPLSIQLNNIELIMSNGYNLLSII